MFSSASKLQDVAQPIVESNPFAQYGLAFVDGGRALQGPERPSCYGITPPILVGDEQHEMDLSTQRDVLTACFKGHVPMQNSQIVDIVSAVFKSVTGKCCEDYAKIIHMAESDWEQFRARLRGNDECSRYDAINLGGLIVRCTINDDRGLPLLFHEIGHSLYLPAGSSYQDEKNAYHFQFVCTKRFEDEIEKLGLGFRYPGHTKFPSAAHERAYEDAESLFAQQNCSRPKLTKESGQEFKSRPKP
jgi:hypothetical protein